MAILRERRGGVSRPLTLTELRRRQRGQRQHLSLIHAPTRITEEHEMDHNLRWLEHLDIITAWGEASAGTGTPPPTDDQLWAASRIRGC